VAPIVSTEVAATASSAQGAHHGQDNSVVSSGFAMPVQACALALVPSSEIAADHASRAKNITMVKFEEMNYR
jgi:hypothetical protein